MVILSVVTSVIIAGALATAAVIARITKKKEKKRTVKIEEIRVFSVGPVRDPLPGMEFGITFTEPQNSPAPVSGRGGNHDIPVRRPT